MRAQCSRPPTGLLLACRDPRVSKPLSPSMLRPPSASRLTGGSSRDGGGGDTAAPARSTQSMQGEEEGGQAGAGSGAPEALRQCWPLTSKDLGRCISVAAKSNKVDR